MAVLVVISACYSIHLRTRLYSLGEYSAGLEESTERVVKDAARLADMAAAMTCVSPMDRYIMGDSGDEINVYRLHFGIAVLVKSFPYNVNDPDDRDYKRICAEEVAEILNEKP